MSEEIQFINSGPNEFQQYLKNNELLIAYFTASWCGPCQAIKPIIESFYSKYKNIEIVKIDIDSNQALSSTYRVTAVPTFISFFKGEESERVTGAKVDTVSNLIVELSKKAISAKRNGKGGIARSGGLNDKIGKYVPKGYEILNESVYFGEFQGLNTLSVYKESDSIKNVFKLDSAKSAVFSDTDSQILVYLPFMNICKVYSILIKFDPKSVAKLAESASELELDDLDEIQPPNKLKLWTNNTSIISFDEIDVNAAHDQVIDIGEVDENGWVECKVRFVKFQKVQSLNIFFDGEDEDFHTVIEKIIVVGVNGDSKDQGKISKMGDEE